MTTKLTLHKGDPLSKAILPLFLGSNNFLWVCKRCGEILNPEYAANDWQMRLDLSRGCHRCHDGIVSQLDKKDTDEYLSHYRYEET